jgi:hypothetical protein
MSRRRVPFGIPYDFWASLAAMIGLIVYLEWFK